MDILEKHLVSFIIVVILDIYPLIMSTFNNRMVLCHGIKKPKDIFPHHPRQQIEK